MDFLATHPNVKLQYCIGYIKLKVETDAAYLILPNMRRRVVGYFYLSAYLSPDKTYPN